jgi:hypothetical protein
VADAKDAEAEAKMALEEALVQVLKHPSWRLPGRLKPAALVQVGCQFPPAHYGEGIGEFDMGRWVDSASEFRLFVYLLPQDEIDNLEGFVIGRRGTEEVLKEGVDYGREITVGLYLSDRELDNGPFLIDQLEISLGLEEP